MKNLYPPPGQKVVNGFISGNQADFECMYNAVSTPLFKIILLKVKDPQIAEQLLEEAFVKAWQYRTAYNPADETIIQWLYKICSQVCDEYMLNDNLSANAMELA